MSQPNEINLGPCAGCFFNAWVPVETESECAFLHPHSVEHIRCDYCWLKEEYMKLRSQRDANPTQRSVRWLKQ